MTTTTTPPDALVTTRDGETTRHLITRDVSEQQYVKLFWGLRLARRVGLGFLALVYIALVPLIPVDLGLTVFIIGASLVMLTARLVTRWRFGAPTLEVVQTPDRLEVRAPGALYRSVSLPREAIAQVFARRLFPRLTHEKHLSVFVELRDGQIVPVADLLPRELAHQLVRDLSPATPPPAPPSAQLTITRDAGTTVITLWPTRPQRLLALGATVLFVGVAIMAVMTQSYAQLKPLLMAGILLMMWLTDNHDALTVQRIEVDAGGWRLTRRLLGLIPLQREAGAPNTLRVDDEGPVLRHDDQPLAWLPTALPARSVATIEAALDPAALPANAPTHHLTADREGALDDTT